MKRFMQGLKNIAIWLYCWLHDLGVSPFGVLALLLAAATAMILPKGEPCTCEEQLDPKWIATLQHQQETDYQAFLETRGTIIRCAAQCIRPTKYIFSD